MLFQGLLDVSANSDYLLQAFVPGGSRIPALYRQADAIVDLRGTTQTD